jgi:hypothetical protein
LRAALRSGDAHAFRGTFRSRTIERQRRKVSAVLATGWPSSEIRAPR